MKKNFKMVRARKPLTVIGHYSYTYDLLILNGGLSRPGGAETKLSGVTTPLKVREWKKALEKHPGADFSRYICMGWNMASI